MKLRYIAIILFLAISLPTVFNPAAWSQARQKCTVTYRTLAEGWESPVVSIRINKTYTGRFLIDTGTSENIMTKTFAAKCGLTPHDARDKNHNLVLSDEGLLQAVTVSDLRIGSLVTSGEFMLNRADQLAPSSQPYDGIIGMNFLKQFAVLFDFPRQQITFWHPGGLSDAERKQIGMDGAVSDNFGDVYKLSARFNDQAEEDILLDTGSSDVLLSRQLAQQLKLQPFQRGLDYNGTDSRRFKTDKAHLNSLLVKELALHNVVVRSLQDNPIRSMPNLLGMGALVQCRLLLDGPRQQAFLKSAAPEIQDITALAPKGKTYSWRLQPKAGDHFKIWREAKFVDTAKDGSITEDTTHEVADVIVNDVSLDRATEFYFDQDFMLATEETQGNDFSQVTPLPIYVLDRKGLLVKAMPAQQPAGYAQTDAVVTLLENTPVPDQPVKIGQSWTTSLESELAQGRKARMVSTLLGLDKINGVTTYHVGVQCVIQTAADPARSITISGAYDLDAGTGRVVNSHYQADNILLGLPTGPLTAKIEVSKRLLLPLDASVPTPIRDALAHFRPDVANTPRRLRTTLSYQPITQEGEQPTILLRLNGTTDARFIMDTTASGSTITDTMAAKLGLTPQPAFDENGKPILWQGEQVKSVDVPTINLGDIPLSHNTLLVVGGSQYSFIPGMPIDGTLGTNFLKRCTMLFDFRRRQVTFWLPGGLTETERRQVGMTEAGLLLKSNDTFPFLVPARFNGQTEQDMPLLVASDVSLISPQLARRLQLQPIRTGQDSYTYDSGTIPVDVARVKTLSLGSLSLDNVEFSYPADEKKTNLSGIGMNVLSQFLLLLDGPQNRLYLKSSSQQVQDITAQIPKNQVFSWQPHDNPGESFDTWSETTVTGHTEKGETIRQVDRSSSHFVLKEVNAAGDITVLGFAPTPESTWGDSPGTKAAAMKPDSIDVYSRTGLHLRSEEAPQQPGYEQIAAVQEFLANHPAPPGPVKIGDHWVTQLENGLVKGEKTPLVSTLLGMDKIDGVLTYRIGLKAEMLKFTANADAIHISGFYNIEAVKAHAMRFQYHIENVNVSVSGESATINVEVHECLLPRLVAAPAKEPAGSPSHSPSRPLQGHPSSSALKSNASGKN